MIRRFRAPGKLVLAGEYAVVEGEPALVMAVDRHLTVQLGPAETWTWSPGGGRVVQHMKTASPFVQAAWRQALGWLRETGKVAIPYCLGFESSLVAEGGRKYGLGSSAAVTVATLGGILACHGLAFDREGRDRLFRLAFEAHREVQGNGSGIDLAASVFGGQLAYRSDRASFEVRPVPFPAAWRWLVGWSGASASTGDLVARIATWWAGHPAQRAAFLAGSRNETVALERACADADVAAAHAALRALRGLLARMARRAGVELETPPLARLCDMAEAAGASGKQSGAGGGDCAIALATDHAMAERVRETWRAAGFEVVPLSMDRGGFCEQPLTTPCYESSP